MRAALTLMIFTVTGCGTEVTDLIPRLACVDGTTFPGNGRYSSDIANEPALTLNGAAGVVAGVLRVTSATRNAVGSAYFSEPLAIDETTSLFVHFAERIGGGDELTGADGLAFVLQSSTAGPSALGLDGGGLGFQNIRPSLALELDTYPNPPDPVQAGHVGVMLDGDIDALPVAFVTPPFTLNDGVLRHVWIDYQAETSELRVYMADTAQRPEAPLFSYTGFALHEALGPLVYAGFSASAGERFNDHDIVGESWVGVSNLPWCGP